MHGRKKSATPPTAEEREALRQKVENYRTLARMVLAQKEQVMRLRQEAEGHGDAARGEGEEGEAEAQEEAKALVLTGKMLRINPDFYSLWNFRRELLVKDYGRRRGQLAFSEAVVDRSFEGAAAAAAAASRRQEDTDTGATSTDTEAATQAQAEFLQSELQLTVEAIRKNPKSYGAWHHRQWVLMQQFPGTDLEQELQLCQQFLQADERNFHCWIHRRFVAELAGRTNQEEFDFSTAKIEQNFSNYSAFHHRSIYLQRLVADAAAAVSVRELVASEMGIIQSAFFTEPDDQAAWWYLRFLLAWCARHADSYKDADPDLESWYSGLVAEQIALVQSLLEVEPDCKWALVMLVHMSLLSRNAESDSDGDGDGDGDGDDSLDVMDMLDRLVEMDPAHSHYYLHLRARAQAQAQATA